MLRFPGEIQTSLRRIRPFIHRTPLEQCPVLSQKHRLPVFAKFECDQVTGSFKVRGALNALLDQNLASEIVTASTGNHGIAVSWAAKVAKFANSPIVFVPMNASESKIQKLEFFGAKVVKVGSDCVDAENAARNFGGNFLSPYADWRVVYGQGTIALEVLEQIPQSNGRTFWVVPVGGGGLISGIALGCEFHPNSVVVGVQPRKNACMWKCRQLDRLASPGEWENFETISDGTAGGIEEGSITLELCSKSRGLIQDIQVVDEDQILKGMQFALKSWRRVVEGSAALTIASIQNIVDKFELKAEKGDRIVLILCGRNVDESLLTRILTSTT